MRLWALWVLTGFLCATLVPAATLADPTTLRIAVAVTPNTLNPLLRTQTTEAFIGRLVFDGLVEATPDGKLQPVLAAVVPSQRNGGISRDGKTIVYKLRRGVRWHDGSAFTSRDVAFTQHASVDLNNNVSARDPQTFVARLDTPDDATVVVHLKQPYAPFVAEWLPNGIGILPAHLLAAARELNDVAFDSAPVGTGAYVFDHWDRGREIVLRANADYFLGRPRIARIVIELMSDENTRNIALRTGETDWSFEAATTSARQFAGSSAVVTKLLAINGYYGLKLQVTRPPLDDVRVRRAIAAAIDRAALVQKISANFALRANSDIGPAVWAYDPTLPQPRLDLERSRRLLAQAGFRRGTTGTLERAGKPLSLQLVYPAGRPADEAYAVTTQAMLGAVGIEVTLKSQQPNVLFAPFAQHGTVFSGNFDLALLGFYNSADPNDRRSFACSARPPDGFNISRWCNAEYDRVTADALLHVDRTIRKRDYRRAAEILSAEVPEVFLYWYKDIHLLRPGVHIDDGAANIALPYRWTKDA